MIIDKKVCFETVADWFQCRPIDRFAIVVVFSFRCFDKICDFVLPTGVYLKH